MAYTAYFQYFGEVTKFGVNALMQIVNIKLQERFDNLYLTISSNGGCNLSALTAYNFLSNVPCNLITHNIGCCESAANIIFLAGKERLSSPCSRFLIHESKRKFSKENLLSKRDILELYNTINSDENMVTQIFHQSAGIDKEKFSQWLTMGKILSSIEAKEEGIVTSIADFPSAHNTEILFIPCESSVK